jgi:hypothetical protein
MKHFQYTLNNTPAWMLSLRTRVENRIRIREKKESREAILFKNMVDKIHIHHHHNLSKLREQGQKQDLGQDLAQEEGGQRELERELEREPEQYCIIEDKITYFEDIKEEEEEEERPTQYRIIEDKITYFEDTTQYRIIEDKITYFPTRRSVRVFLRN